jgi:DNA (cytosine-5)-methyltransferase 1
MKVAGLFAGVGGIELGLSREGFESIMLCEFDPAAQAVLRARFPGTEIAGDVRALRRLPKGTELLTAGFPCQDLSQAGKTKGIDGERSGLVAEVFRLLRASDVPHVLIENVSFMLQLEQGRAMRLVIDSLTALGYRWAYRVLDSQAFGIPQRRQRVFIFASKEMDPGAVLFASDLQAPIAASHHGRACGFYWTEGERGLGWAIDAVPTLKGGSTVGIPSPPAIWLPDGQIVTPDVRDAERLQGFPVDWTKPTIDVARGTFRWKQMGNAVSVPVARWLGGQIKRPRNAVCPLQDEVNPDRRWPSAAMSVDGSPIAVRAGMWPVQFKRDPLADFLRFPTKPLSARASLGFLQRLHKGQLHLPDGFLEAVEAHLCSVGGVPPARPSRSERAEIASRARARKRKSAEVLRRKGAAAAELTGLLFDGARS